MEKLKKIVDSKPEWKSEKSQYLKIKGAGGPIRVKLVGCENATNREYETQKEVQGINLLFSQDGEPKKYFVPTLGKDGKFHYLIERFAEIKEGTEVILEFQRKKGSVKGFISVQVAGEEEQEKVVGENDVPIITEDGIAEEDFGAELGIEEEN